MFSRENRDVFIMQVIPMLGKPLGLQLMENNQFINFFLRHKVNQHRHTQEKETNSLKLTIGNSLFKSYVADFYQVGNTNCPQYLYNAILTH